MVTVVDNYSEQNLYEGFTVAEMTSQAVTDVNDIVNEMEMGILQAEHCYLVENGVEVVYEANKEAFTKVKTWIVEKINYAVKVVTDLFNSLVKKVQDALVKAKAAFIQLGIKSSDMSAGIAALKSGGEGAIEKLPQLREKILSGANKIVPVYAGGKFISREQVIAWANGDYITDSVKEPLKSAKEWKEKIAQGNPGARTMPDNWDELDKQINAFLTGSTAADLRAINDGKKEAVKALKDLQGEARKADNVDHDRIKALGDAIKHNTAVAAGATSLYWDYFRSYAQIAKSVCKLGKEYANHKMKKAAEDADKPAPVDKRTDAERAADTKTRLAKLKNRNDVNKLNKEALEGPDAYGQYYKGSALRF